MKNDVHYFICITMRFENSAPVWDVFHPADEK